LENWLDGYRLLEERFTYAGNGCRDRFRKALADEVVQSGSVRVGGCIRGFAFRRLLGLDGRLGGSGDGRGGLREHGLRGRGLTARFGRFLQ
jgi:hypothetical protein